MKNKFIQLIELTQIKTNIPDFKVGSIIVVELWVNEGEKKRIQKFEGVVISKRNRGFNSSFTARKISHGEGVERVFKTHSPIIHKIIITSQVYTRKAKLYYFRNLTQKTLNKLKYITQK